jgi:hypothetical protein
LQDKESEGNLEVKITFEPIELFLIFYIDEDHKGNTLMAEVAKTRLQNIKNSSWYDSQIHYVHCPPIQALDEIIEIAYNTEIKICPLKSWPHQMEECGWGQIDVLWADKDAICVFYGCNTGHKPSGFAQRISKLSNFKDVEVWGQSTYSYPSFYPDYRVTSMARNMKTGWDLRKATYLVGGNEGQGWDATSYKPNKDTLDEETIKEDFPKANPMNCFKNGTHIRETHQGYFNDHRK